ncbi:MAG: TonB-dependent receptor [Acidobacteria bacterium]|nr:TonB-dependent receptor [Acidobacteriota bacterium]
MKWPISSTLSGILLLAIFLGLPALLWAQTAANTGRIVGAVVDPSGAAIPGAEITARNAKTNYSRTVQSDSEGRYSIPYLPLGTYEVGVSASGFALNTQEVFLTLGSSISVNAQLSMDTRNERIDVTAELLQVEATAASDKSILTEVQIHNLPSNGRQIEGLLVQTPGALIEPMCNGYSISGQKGIYSSINVDGGDYNSTFGCGLRGRSESAPAFSMEALSEFHIVRNVFSSEFGRSTGGLVNMSTKSGTNNFHGSGFFLGRDSSLAALDPFGREALSQIFQFGGSLGGPIVPNRTFFFSALELQKADKPVEVLYSALDNQNLRGTPAANALLAAAPEEKILAISDSLSSINRIDHEINPNNRLLGRFDYTRTEANNNPGSNYQTTGPSIESVTNRAASGQTILINQNYTALGQLTSFLSPSMINELRFQFARELRPRSTNGTGPEVTLWNAGELVGYYGPQASGLGFGNLGFSSSDNRMQLVNNFSAIHGSHSLKAGFDFSRISGNIVFNPGSNALYLFNSLADYLARRPTQYQQFIGAGTIDMSMNLLAFYVQDEWRPFPGLTLTPGFRYEAQFNPDYLDSTAPGSRVPMATAIPDDTGMFAPRLGIAWDIGNNNRTVVRAGGGLFYASAHMGLMAQSILFNGGNPELASRIVITNPKDLMEAFDATGRDLLTAPLGQLPVFSAEEINYFFGDLASTNLTLRAPT